MQLVRNVELVAAAIVVSIAAAFVFFGFSGSSGGIFWLASAAAFVLLVLGFAFFEYLQRGKGSLWLEPVSARSKDKVINFVVSLWLCLIGSFFLIVLLVSHDLDLRIGGCIAVFVGLAAGWLLRRQLASRTWIPYGLTLTIAFLMTMVLFRILRS